MARDLSSLRQYRTRRQGQPFGNLSGDVLERARSLFGDVGIPGGPTGGSGMLQGSVPGSPVHQNVGPETYSGDTIVNFQYGIVVPASTGSVTVQNNSVVNRGTAMVFQSCTGWTLSANTIDNATYCFSNAASSFTATASQVSFNNVGQFVQSTMSCP